MENFICLNDLKPGQRATVKSLKTAGSMRRRLIDVGLVEGTEIECVGRSPAGDPSAFLVRGTVLALRYTDCRKIIIENIL